MPKSNTKKTRPNKKTASTPTNREQFLQAHPKEKELQASNIKNICSRFSNFRDKALKWGEVGIELVNEGRELGLFIKGFLKELPGGQMTTDFWMQFEGKFKDKHGNPITIEQLKVLVRLADNLDQPVEDVNIALSWRKEIQMAAGFWLEMERAQGTVQDKNYYNDLLQLLSPKKLLPVLTGLENDPRWGSILTWPEERKESARLQIKPTKELLDRIWEELGPVTDI